MKRRPDWRKLALIVLIMAALAAAWRYTPLSELFTREQVVAWAGAVRETPWAPVALVLAYTPAALLMFPRPILTLIAVIAFGLWLGVGCAVAGIMAAALATYYAGRLLPQDSVRRLAGRGFDPAIRVLRHHGVLAIFALNVMPAPPFAVQGLIAGSIRINVWHYALGSLLGLAPAVLTWTVFGGQIAAVLEGSSRVSWWLVACVIAAGVALTYGVRRWFAKQAAADAAGGKEWESNPPGTSDAPHRI